MLPHVQIQSSTQGGYMTREQLSMYTLSKKKNGDSQGVSQQVGVHLKAPQ